MSRFDELPEELQEALIEEAPGSVIYVPGRHTRVQFEARAVRIRDKHRSQLEGGMTTRQSIRAIMWSYDLSRSQVFRILQK